MWGFINFSNLRPCLGDWKRMHPQKAAQIAQILRREPRRPTLFKCCKWPSQKQSLGNKDVVDFLLEYGCFSFLGLLQIITNLVAWKKKEIYFSFTALQARLQSQGVHRAVFPLRLWRRLLPGLVQVLGALGAPRLTPQYAWLCLHLHVAFSPSGSSPLLSLVLHLSLDGPPGLSRVTSP